MEDDVYPFVPSREKDIGQNSSRGGFWEEDLQERAYIEALKHLFMMLHHHRPGVRGTPRVPTSWTLWSKTGPARCHQH